MSVGQPASASGTGFGRRRWLLAGLASCALVIASLYAWHSQRYNRISVAWPDWIAGPLIDTSQPERVRHLAAPACAACHQVAYDDWKDSHHALANRPLPADAPWELFPEGQTYTKDGETFRLVRRGGQPALEVRQAGSEPEVYPVVGILGETPLRQFLIARHDGQVQVTTVAWDVARQELFDIFDGNERLRGDWGHWAGQGLNWNSNCAWCHMTDFRKRLQSDTLQYQSTWQFHGVSCAQCHPGGENHSISRQSGGELPTTLLSRQQTFHNCMSCHSRRDELSAHGFRPGDHYFDHFALSLPDERGLYFADGQADDEVFATGSLHLSKMGHAGMTCTDCHSPHSMKTILPVYNNALCQSCHGPGINNAAFVDPALQKTATVIDPFQHSFHKTGTEGSLCVDCHMPQRNFMSRDPRRDHRFPTPDPVLTMELGVPNACSSCHKDQTHEWSLKWLREWYGPGYDERREPERRRARWFAAADRGELDGAELAALLDAEPNATWRAAMAGRLVQEPWQLAAHPPLRSYLEKATRSPSDLERQRAFTVLAAADGPALDTVALAADPRRAVRVGTLRAAPQLAPRDPLLADDWHRYLWANADRPANALSLAQDALTAGDSERMGQLVRFASSLDLNNSEIRRLGGTLFHEAGDAAAASEWLRAAVTLDPANPSAHFSLALQLAEQRQLPAAIHHLELTVALEPTYPRAAYNLVVACWQAGRADAAWSHLMAARRAMPGDRDLAQLEAWLRQQTGR
jgi:predicted CXXCH cytochrome family protein